MNPAASPVPLVDIPLDPATKISSLPMNEVESTAVNADSSSTDSGPSSTITRTRNQDANAICSAEERTANTAHACCPPSRVSIRGLTPSNAEHSDTRHYQSRLCHTCGSRSGDLASRCQDGSRDIEANGNTPQDRRNANPSTIESLRDIVVPAASTFGAPTILTFLSLTRDIVEWQDGDRKGFQRLMFFGIASILSHIVIISITSISISVRASVYNGNQFRSRLYSRIYYVAVRQVAAFLFAISVHSALPLIFPDNINVDAGPLRVSTRVCMVIAALPLPAGVIVVSGIWEWARNKWRELDLWKKLRDCQRERFNLRSQPQADSSPAQTQESSTSVIGKWPSIRAAFRRPTRQFQDA
ncbi:hypothetical protein AX16_004991 [Volvariella volvacea WC 439]|nr:hypothetical protein AX16_004991 [Volvariella volvacea WC 439]